MSRKFPLEIILRPTGHAELVDANDDTLWVSNSDPEFTDQVSSDFLTEEDVDEILAYLSDAEILNEYECSQFESGAWDVTEESMAKEEGVEADDDDSDESEYFDDSDEH